MDLANRPMGAVAGAVAGLTGAAAASAQSLDDAIDLRDRLLAGEDAADLLDDGASAGNGGEATASADGGAIAIEDINSGGNDGNAVAAGDTAGNVAIDGGDVSALTDLGISADGGTAIADASGGDDNFAFVS